VVQNTSSIVDHLYANAEFNGDEVVRSNSARSSR